MNKRQRKKARQKHLIRAFADPRLRAIWEKEAAAYQAAITSVAATYWQEVKMAAERGRK
jgi:hypothetical protein